jgi:hypothetical protein
MSLVLAFTLALVAAPAERRATDAVGGDDPSVAAVWDYVCGGSRRGADGAVRKECPCFDEAGQPAAGDATEGLLSVASAYFGSFTGAGVEEVVASLRGCFGANSPAAVLVLRRGGPRWTRVAYTAPEEFAPLALDFSSLDELTDDCLHFPGPAGDTLACFGALFRFDGLSIGQVAAATIGAEGVSFEPLLRWGANVRSSCDAQPLRHDSELVGWEKKDANGDGRPDLVLRLRAGSRRTARRGNGDDCHADRPPLQDYTVTFLWDGSAFTPSPASAKARSVFDGIVRALAPRL